MNNPIIRTIENKKFVYKIDNKQITDQKILDRIKKIRIPPKWKNVKISQSDIDYLQSIGEDAKGRIQYIYHPLWNVISKIDKYDRIKSFSEKLPILFKKVNDKLKSEIDLSDKEYIVCILIKLLEKTHSRIGNDHFAEENNTYGLTTLLKKHVNLLENNEICFSFVGKKSIKQQFSIIDKLCSNVLKLLKQIPGERLFKTTHKEYVRSIDVNEYIKKIMGEDFSVKDFRTYSSNKLFLTSILSKDIPKTETEMKRTINKCYDEVATKLGNSRAVSRSSYVMPIIAEKYIQNPAKFIKDKPKLENIFTWN